MAILKERKVWRRDTPTRRTTSVNALTQDECANVVRALRVLQIRHRTLEGAAKELGVASKHLFGITAPRKPVRPTAGLALRIARLVGASVEDVLTGAWPKEGACPMCGRCG